MIKKHFNLTKAAKHRALFSSILTASLSFSAIGGEVLEYYDPYRLLELPTITTPGESYVFVDIDDDGDQDAFRQNVFFENIGSAAKPSYIERVGDENPASDIPSYSKLEFVDIDADGDLDVFIGFQKSVSVGELYENTGSAQLATFVKRGINDLGDLYSSLPTRFSFVDIDDDGDQDVFLEDGFYENTGAEGAPFFTKKVLSHLDALNTLIAESYALPVFIDLDEDGDLDAFYKHGADLLFLENTGDASKATFNSTVDMGVSFNNDRKPIWQAVNIDADSDIDLVIDGTPLFNDGSLGLDAFDFTKIQSRLETRGMSFADLDGDLDADAFLVGVSGGKYSSGLNTVLQYTNEGNMVFATDPVPWAGEHISSSVAFSTQFVDLDQDGDLDQLVYIDDTLKFFENIATAISPEMVEKTGSDNAFSSIVLESGGRIAPEFVDIDDDGDLDFFTLDSVPEESGSVFEIAFYKNIGTVDAAEYQRELLETPFLIHIDSFVNNNKRFAFSDIDLDGDQDLLIADSRGLRLHKNIGDKQNANFILQDIELSPLKNISIPADGVYGLKFVDIDNNGDKDLIINDNLLYLSRRVEKDTDSDGLPDDWETLYGLDPTNPDDGGLHSDKDGDGYSNYVEFLSGTDPNNPNDPGGSASDPCLSNPISSVIHIDNKQYSSLDDITCQASEGISLTGDVTLSSGTQASFSAPLIHILPNVSFPAGSQVHLSSLEPVIVDDFSADTATTGLLEMGVYSTGEIEQVGDQDWFKVSLVAGQQIQVDLEGVSTTKGSLDDTYLRGIYDSAGVKIAGTEDDDGGEGYNSRLIFTVPSTGDYYIAAGDNGGTGTYGLLVSVIGEVLFSSPLNDTGITTCSDATSNGLTCPVAGFPGQDGESGRDVTHNDDSDGHAGFSFTKLDAEGNDLAASAEEWNCVRDNVTGLIWEAKTDDGGIHDKYKRYRWGGVTALGSGTVGTYYNDWDGLVNGSNTEALCGYADWRVPNNDELLSLVDYSRYNKAIDSDYFPNTASDVWSSSPEAYSVVYAWHVTFNYGSTTYNNRFYALQVRLVRSGEW